jgi:hypothetical protein
MDTPLLEVLSEDMAGVKTACSGGGGREIGTGWRVLWPVVGI